MGVPASGSVLAFGVGGADGQVFGIEVPDYHAWSWWIWFLHLLGALYLLGFVGYYLRLRPLEKRAAAAAARQGPDSDEALKRYHNALAGFPAAFYAKQFGMHPKDPPRA